MNIEEFQTYCISKKGVEECFPFDEVTMVYKVMGKMFAATGLAKEEFTANLKCDPELAEELRAKHPEVIPGFHMSKKHWNTVSFEGSLSEMELREMIDHSYNLVVSKLTKKLKAELESL